MYRSFKALHLLGLTLFLGSIFGHVVASSLGGAPGDAHFLASREHIVRATSVLTLPGLGLAVAAGVAMLASARVSPLRQPWLMAHIGLAAVVIAVSAIVVVPAGSRALSLAMNGDTGANLHAALLAENIFGALNVALTLAILLLGVFKPHWARRSERLAKGAAH